MRQAISFALNKEDFVAHFINNRKPATGLVPVGHINEETEKILGKKTETFLYMMYKVRKDLGRSEKSLE